MAYGQGVLEYTNGTLRLELDGLTTMRLVIQPTFLGVAHIEAAKIGHHTDRDTIITQKITTGTAIPINNVFTINMDSSLNVVSYNCRGFPKTAEKLWEKPTIKLMLEDNTIDIMCLQETFLSKQDLSCLNVIDKDFLGVGASSTDLRDKLITGHPYGGVAILYRKKHSKCISPIIFNLDWVIGISIDSGSNKHVILCVYLKCVSSSHADHKDIFQGQLEELKAIINDLDTTSVTIIGDWNADLVKISHPHGPLLRQFASESGLIVSSEHMLPNDSFTYISEMRPGETSWLDHCISSQDGHSIINNMYINYPLSCRDHIPVVMNLGIDKLPIVEDEINDVAPKINWDKYDAVKLREYSMMSDIHLSRLTIPNEALDCRDPKCSNEAHKNQTNLFYDSICNSLIDSSNGVFGSSKSKNFDCKPGFNDYVKDLHETARKRFVAWREANKPKDNNNPFFREMTVSRARFKLAMRFIKRHEDQLRQDAIANALCNDSDGKFWKEIKKLSPNNVPLPVSIDDATGKQEVADMWKEHFKNLLNCVKGKNSSSLISDCEFNPNSVISPGEIEDAINKLVGGKSCGLDGIYAEHLKYASNNYWTAIAKCVTSFLVHGYLPESLMSVILVPIIKDKSGKINSKDNYRPIAIASIMSKLLEIILLERLTNHLSTTSHQFGFKSGHSTDACIYVLKEAINSYISQQSSVYLCFLDASKAFDRVNHYVLFDKLIKRGVPRYLVRILIYWYSNQRMFIRWGNIMSESFNVSNGVKQEEFCLHIYLICIWMT